MKIALKNSLVGNGNKGDIGLHFLLNQEEMLQIKCQYQYQNESMLITAEGYGDAQSCVAHSVSGFSFL